jgi:2'-hydroxyisoflavone reductase
VTIFTRGQTQPTLFREVFADVEHLIGDRNQNLQALQGRTWDVVIDNSGQRVEWARNSTQLLEDSAQHYLFVSSTGVYLPYLTTDIREDTKLVLADDPPQENPSYGVMKALSEIEVQKAFGDRAIVVRPQYIFGPGDRTGRSAYWPVRLQRGGEVLAPGRKGDPVMLIDVRDLTEWMIRLVENGNTGVYNAAGPASPLTMEEFLHGVRAATSSQMSWTWIEDYSFLEEQRLRYAIPWVMVEGDYIGNASINIEKALSHGLTHRPIAVTLMNIYEWWYSDAVTEQRREEPRFPLTAEREAEILSAWRARRL